MEAVRQRARIAWVTVLSLIAAVIAGVLPLAAHAADAVVSVRLVPDEASVTTGATDGYTVTVTNASPDPVTLVRLAVRVPDPGFTTLPGRVTGLTTTDPVMITDESGVGWWAWGEAESTWPPGSAGIPPGESSWLHVDVGVQVDAGDYPSVADVVTDTGTATSDPATITVLDPAANLPPTADAGPALAGGEGEAIAVAGSAYDPEGDPLTTAWSVVPLSRVDAGAMCIVADPAALDTTVTCTDGGTYRLRLTVADAGHGPVTAQADLTVGDLPPTVTIVAPVPGDRVVAGRPLTVTVAYADPGANDAHISFVEFCDGYSAFGAPHGGTFSVAHAIATTGDCAIDVVVTDDDGKSAATSVTVTVTPRPLTVTGTGTIAVDGRRTTLRASVSRTEAGARTGTTRIVRGVHVFVATAITRIDAVGTTVTWTGSGRWDGVARHRFSVTFVDNPPGLADRLRIRVTDRLGVVVLSVAAGVDAGGDLRLVWR